MVYILFLFYKGGNWNTEGFSNWSKVTQFISGKLGFELKESGFWAYVLKALF